MIPAALLTALSAPDIAAMDAGAAAAAVNAMTVATVGTVSMSQVLIWCGKNNVLPQLQTLAGSAGQLQGVAAAAILMFHGGFPSLDMSNPDVAAMVGAMQAGGVITADMQAELVSLATTTQPLPIASGFGRMLDFGDVQTFRSAQ